MTEKLKRCPFCGGKAELFGTENKIFFVECLNCDVNSNFDTPEEAIAAWNRRISDECIYPCPNKCGGGEAEIKIDVEAYGRWYLICQSCGARTDKYKDMEAINSWDGGGILSESALKPCPFCRSSDVRIASLEGEEGCFVQCRDCFSRGAWSEDRETACENWNMRPELELKPCPFCGCEDVYKHDIALYDTYGEGYVLCPSCKAQVNFMIPRTPDMTDRYAILARIVAAWNRRCGE